NPIVESYRRVHPSHGASSGHCGYFVVPIAASRRNFNVIVSDGMGWDHVSVSLPDRCPTWAEMCHIKKLFFGPDEIVMQLHPAERDYRNCHPYCLHLWRPQDQTIPLPDPLMVAPA
ncbi:MAG: DUF7694 domain-containing protein, partial [Acidiferrobacteraceae bacterium]